MFNLEHNRIYELAIDHNDVCFDKINEHLENFMSNVVKKFENSKTENHKTSVKLIR